MSTPVRTVIIPLDVWTTLLAEFAKHKGGVERVAYLDGYITDMTGHPDETPVSVVASVVLPNAHLTPGSYQVDAAAMSQAGSHLRVRRMVRLAQVHTHGNDWVDHSETDDARAYSQRPGSVSIVVPRHGTKNPTLDDCGIHLRTESGWQRLTSAEAADAVRIEPSLYDHRSPICLKGSGPSTGIFFKFRRLLT
jgi:hypothetical protein